MHSQKSLLVFLAVLLVEICVGLPVSDDSKIISFENEHNIDNYKFSYYTDYGISRSETGELKTKGDEQILVVVGSYNYRGTDGKRYTVTYKADENGYRAKVTAEYEAAHFPAAALASLAGGGLG